MCRFMETKTIYANNYLFKIGDPDDSIYVVESGRVQVYITDEKGRRHLIKECTEGHHIFSLLSIMDVLAGDLKPYKTVSAKAVEDTVILRLPGKAFVDVLQKYPEHLVRITQIIIVRLQRVTFTALHSYLGLTYEILRNFDNRKLRNNKSNKNSLTASESSGNKKTKPEEAFRNPLDSSSKSSHRHHHHHHHHHQCHGSNRTADAIETSSIFSNESYVGNRKYSIPLPPISFFSDDCETCKNQEGAVGDLNKTSSENQLLPTNEQQNASDEKLKHSSPLKISPTKPFRGKDPSTSSECNESYDTIDNMSSSDDEHSHGSEFGESTKRVNLQEKLPAVQAQIAGMLKLNDPAVLSGKITLMSVSEGTILCREGDYNCSLMFVIAGFLTAAQKELDGQESVVFYCREGQMCGNLSVISGETSLFTIKARQDSEIAFINKQCFHQIITHQPTVVLSVANNVVKRMSPFVRQIDFALEWNLIESGSALFRQDNKAESTYIVLNGRLRSILKTESNKQLVGEFGRGDLVGIVEVLMETNNATTVYLLFLF